MKECIVSVGMEQEVANLMDQICLLDKMTVSACEILSSTKYIDTLEETSHRQNICESLTNISDTVFEFFTILEATSRKCLTYETLMNESKHIYKYTIENLLSDSNLFECFVKKCCNHQTLDIEASQNDDVDILNICDNLVRTCESALLLYEKIIQLFTAVNFSQFRKDYLRVIKREKSKALRKRVLDRKDKKDADFLPFNSIIEDKSQGKKISHLKLKAVALQDSTFYMTYKKAELVQILNAYGQVISTKATKAELGEKLYNYLLNEDNLEMSNPDIISTVTTKSESTEHFSTNPAFGDSEPQPGTSGVITHSLPQSNVFKRPYTKKY
jgi:hypothetical protein